MGNNINQVEFVITAFNNMVRNGIIGIAIQVRCLDRMDSEKKIEILKQFQSRIH
jgi:hypothetical protein